MLSADLRHVGPHPAQQWFDPIHADISVPTIQLSSACDPEAVSQRAGHYLSVII
jgi:hypothetical protein